MDDRDGSIKGDAHNFQLRGPRSVFLMRPIAVGRSTCPACNAVGNARNGKTREFPYGRPLKIVCVPFFSFPIFPFPGSQKRTAKFAA